MTPLYKLWSHQGPPTHKYTHTATFPNMHTHTHIRIHSYSALAFLYTTGRSAELCKCPQMGKIVREIF